MNDTAAMLLQILLSSGVIWAAIMLFKRCFRSRLSPRAHLALWLILVVRLVVPFTLDTGVHLITVPAAVSETVPAAAVPAAAQPRIPIRAEAQQAGGASVPAEVRQSAAAPVSGQESAAGSAVQRQVSPSEIAVAVWIAGILAGATLSVRGYRQMRRAVRRRLVPGAEVLHLLFQECMSELGIRRRVVLAVQKRLAGPALMFPNVVLMPEDLGGMDREQIKMALRHELMHFVRGDQIRSAGLNLLRIVWWFSPFVWLAVREIREDIETACDADVVRQLGDGGR
ncbi:MAG: hypothetical protein HDQ87_03025, partial [Clostridia bacterium]|nr:hypothetical protein [Clostridia bacterium]